MMSRERFGEDVFDARLRSLFEAAERQTRPTADEQMHLVEAVLGRIEQRRRVRMGIVGGTAGLAAAVSTALLSRLGDGADGSGVESYYQSYIAGIESALQWVPTTDLLVMSVISAGLAGLAWLAYVICSGEDMV